MTASLAPGTGARVRRPRALIVDDERDSLDLYEEYLQGAGWDVRTAESGDDALVVAPVYSPDIIVLDLAMPGLDGFQTLLRLKVEARTTRIPVLVLTGFATDRNAKRAMRMGAAQVLFKPCEAQALDAALGAILTKPPSAPGQESG